MKDQLTNSAKNGTGANDKKQRPFGNIQRKQRLGGNEKEFSISELQEQVKEIVTRKRNMEPPEKTLPNNEYNNLQREGLKKLIEMEKLPSISDFYLNFF